MKKYLLVLFILNVSFSAWAIDEREGYCKSMLIPQNGSISVFTVPEGMRFVLLQVNGPYSNFHIEVNETTIIYGFEILYSTSYSKKVSHDFPDKCVVVKSGETLTIVNQLQEGDLQLNIVGYFYNCNCSSLPVADLNKDCKVNFSDLAILASEWLIDNIA